MWLSSTRRWNPGFARPVAEPAAPPLSGEQLLLIAEEFCAAHPVRVRSFAALVAAAAVPGARLHGIPVFDSPRAGGAALAEAVRSLRPLSAENETFARVCQEVYRRFCAE